MLFNFNRQETQDIFIDAHDALKFFDRNGFRCNIRQHVVTLAILSDQISQCPQTDIFRLLNGSSIVTYDIGKFRGQSLDLSRRQILSRNKNVLIKSHKNKNSFWLMGLSLLSLNKAGLVRQGDRTSSIYCLEE